MRDTADEPGALARGRTIEGAESGQHGSQERVPLSPEDRQALLRIARQALAARLGGENGPEIERVSAALREPRATFITLWRRGNGGLRGCRGETRPLHALAESVAHMAVAAATDDPRFPPVAYRELPLLRIEINALTPLEPIAPDEIVIGRHGLLIVRGGNAGLLLPEVPVRFGWDRTTFLESLCHKAWLPARAWTRSDTRLYGFETEEWEEDESGV